MSNAKLIIHALEYAARKHEGQYRKTPKIKIPYISHPAGVGIFLQKAGCDEEVIAAGILHDVIEDCGVTRKELAKEFNERISDLVWAVSEHDKSKPWKERKAIYLEQLKTADQDALAIASADHIYNMTNILMALEDGVDIWASFEPEMEEKLDIEKQLLEIVRGKISDVLTKELEGVIKELSSL
ncbi:MAG: HD domain-containing protein [Patescibacteria group bacterium]|nr:HD domain-containing protein [Patescibacteria group bacterium]MBU2509124.1 HD domain-containing protein [Patescibacteria group bacterium]